MRRSMMFLPSNNPNLIQNGPLLGADAVIFDLEDAVAPNQKDAARELLRHALQALDFGRCEKIVRINGLDSTWWEEDLETILPLGIDVVMPPKTCDAEYIHTLDAKMSEVERQAGMEEGSVKILALLETAMGIENAYPIAGASKRMTGLFLGAEDLTADLHAKRTKKGDEIFYARQKLLCSARAAGIEAYDTPFTDTTDLDGLKADAEFAKSLGFSGKACISPAHVEAVNRIFSPSEADIEYAKQVFAAIAEAKRQGKGAISLRGKMIDAPIVARARQTLEMASQIEGVDYFEEIM